MLIIGLNAFHPDSSACALKDGKLVAAVAEERLGKRVKHVAGFPGNALREVLRMAGAGIRDVDYLAIGNDSNANLGAKVSHVVSSPFKSARGVLTHFQRRAKMQSIQQLVAEACGVAEADCRFQVVRVEHHLAHIASSYFASDFDQAAGFSYDGAGDFTSAMFARCQGNRIEILDRVQVPHSLGFFYTALCQFIGFTGFGEEYKVMGLAAYGEPVYLDLMREMLVIPNAEKLKADSRGTTVHGPRTTRPKEGNRNGQFRLNPRYFRPLGKNLEECVDEKGEIVLPPLYSDELVRQLGQPRRRGSELAQREKDIAASCQAHFEEVVLRCLSALHARVPTSNLVTAGGCALNGVCNARILRDTPFNRSYIQCAASDDGTAIGAALYVWNAVLGKPRAGCIEHAYWGPEHSEQAMEDALGKAGLRFERFERDGAVGAGGGASQFRPCHGLVSRPQRVGPARAGQSLHSRASRLAGHEGFDQSEDQAARGVSPVCALRSGRGRRRLLRADGRKPVHDACGEDQAGQARGAGSRMPRGRDGPPAHGEAVAKRALLRSDPRFCGERAVRPWCSTPASTRTSRLWTRRSRRWLASLGRTWTCCVSGRL